MKRRDFVIILAGLAPVYLTLGLFAAPDLREFLLPWLNHLQAAGPIAAFASPFGNYAPPYLYLLAGTSLLPLPGFVAVKLLAVACLAWLAWAAARLAKSLGATDQLTIAAMVLALPSVAINAPMLGQCDALWVGCCLLAVAAAVEKKVLAMGAWAGLAFAIKAQAIFLAPFVLAIVIRERKWSALLVPPAIYVASVLPAWAAGWPLRDVLTIYLQQFDAQLLSTAPNLWATADALYLDQPQLFTVGYALGGAVTIGLVWRISARHMNKCELLQAALLVSIAVPFVLPKMHERYFLLADLLALCLAYVRRDRSSIVLCVLVQLGSLLSLLAYLSMDRWVNAAGSLAMGVALLLCASSRWNDKHNGPIFAGWSTRVRKGGGDRPARRLRP